MDDIVTTLRTMVQFTNAVAGDVCWQAADEIERLRETVRLLKYNLEHQVCECSHCLDEEGAS